MSFYTTDSTPKDLLRFVNCINVRAEVLSSEVLVLDRERDHDGNITYPDADEAIPYDDWEGDNEELEFLIKGEVSPEYLEEVYLNGHPEKLQFKLDSRWESFKEDQY